MVIGGLFSSTVLTLVVIPVIYSLVDGGKQAVARRFGGGGEAEVVAPATPEVAPTGGWPADFDRGPADSPVRAATLRR